MTPFRNLIGNIANLHEARMTGSLLDKCSKASNTIQISVLHQFTKCAVGRHPRDTELRNKLVFRRYAAAGRPVARAHMRQDMIFKLTVKAKGASCCAEMFHAGISRPSL